jgi:Flp pilus assembly protein TadD
VPKAGAPPVIDFRKLADRVGAKGAAAGTSEGEDGEAIEPAGDGAPEAVVLRPPPADRNPGQAEFYVKLGEKALRDGNPAAALDHFTKARGFDNTNANAIAGLGAVALRQGNVADAAVHLEAAARLAPMSARIHTLRGQALLAGGKRDEAAAAFRRALKLDPDDQAAVKGYRDATARNASRGTIDDGQ